MSLNVLLLTDEDDFESALPTVESFAQTMRDRLSDHGDAARRTRRRDHRCTHRPRNGSDGLPPVDHRNPRHRGGGRRRAGGLRLGDVDWQFDDVMLPAVGADELQARLRLAITRRRSSMNGSLKFGDLLLEPASFTASLDGEHLGLTLTEFKLLSFLVQHAGRAFSRTRLMQEVWGPDCTGRVRTVDVHVRRLRAKLGTEHESMIDTVRGVGYMAATPPHPAAEKCRSWRFAARVDQLRLVHRRPAAHVETARHVEQVLLTGVGINALC